MVYLIAFLCGIALAAHVALVLTAVAAIVRGEWWQAAFTAALTVALVLLPANAAFWTGAGLVLLAIALLAGFVCLMAEAGKGGFFHWYGCWKLGECCLELLGLVLAALLQVISDSSNG